MTSKNIYCGFLILLFTLLTACGGGGGGGGGTDPGGNNDPGGNPGGNNGGGNTVSGDFLCTSHTTSTTNTIGNNTYEFIAADGECFGAQEDHGLLKQAVDLIPEQISVQPENDGLVAMSATGKLTSEVNSLTGFHFLNLVLELTNTSDQDVCVEIPGAFLQDQDDVDITEMEMKVLGDMYYSTQAFGRFRNDCIPPGQTRIAWSRETRSGDDLPNGVDALDHITVPFHLRVQDGGVGEYYLEALTPNETVWGSSKQTGGGTDYYGHTVETDFTNNGSETAFFSFYLEDVIYFDQEGYMLYATLFSIADYFGIESNEVTENHLTVPVGNTIGFKNEYDAIVPSLGATPTINGRASKIVIGLDICDDVPSANAC